MNKMLRIISDCTVKWTSNLSIGLCSKQLNDEDLIGVCSNQTFGFINNLKATVTDKIAAYRQQFFSVIKMLTSFSIVVQLIDFIKSGRIPLKSLN